MRVTIIGAMALSVLLSGARAEIPPETEEQAPRLRITRLGGRLEVAPGLPGADAAALLPGLPSGSIVRVRSGFAVLDSDYHVTVRAAEGDAFQFVAARPEGSRAGTVRISAVEREPRSLEVSVGDRKFRLRKGGAVSATSVWAGEMLVRSEGAGAFLAPGSRADDGSLLSKPRRMPPGDAVTAVVPETTGFENPAIERSRLSASGGGRTLVVEAARPGEPALRAREAEARRILSGWPVTAQRTAEVILEKYGPPDLAIPDRLSWYENAPWTLTTVYRDPAEHLDVLEQTIAYPVPRDKAPALAKLDVALRLSRDGRELSATSESEETNVLALNLADEVVRERRTPEDARAFYLKTVVQMNAGRSSPYLQRLRFR